MRQASIFSLEGIPGIKPGMSLSAEILDAARGNGVAWQDGDILVVAQKIVSKAEGRIVRLTDVTPSAEAEALARTTGKDARLAELVLRESSAVLRSRTNVLIVEHRLGHVMANAGIDRSNVDASPDDEDIALLLPEDPDLSARRLRSEIEQATGRMIGVIISDSFGRPWRIGTVGVAIGVAGPPAVLDRRGDPDLFGRKLQITEVGFADAVATAAVLVMGEGDEGRPAAIVRGLAWKDSGQSARDVLRPRSQDLFR